MVQSLHELLQASRKTGDRNCRIRNILPLIRDASALEKKPEGCFWSSALIKARSFLHFRSSDCNNEPPKAALNFKPNLRKEVKRDVESPGDPVLDFVHFKKPAIRQRNYVKPNPDNGKSTKTPDNVKTTRINSVKKLQPVCKPQAGLLSNQVNAVGSLDVNNNTASQPRAIFRRRSIGIATFESPGGIKESLIQYEKSKTTSFPLERREKFIRSRSHTLSHTPISHDSESILVKASSKALESKYNKNSYEFSLPRPVAKTPSQSSKKTMIPIRCQSQGSRRIALKDTAPASIIFEDCARVTTKILKVSSTAALLEITMSSIVAYPDPMHKCSAEYRARVNEIANLQASTVRTERARASVNAKKRK
ncbi:hypothetical protein Ciccas_010171 [Cichlidogyrus casuarinus]|uniref:Uncharacterized protein n=1 Tax=Cichlidogyrus casuarinus TaxID=1844966 RepID=A0ABD2PUW8_9PLAT